MKYVFLIQLLIITIITMFTSTNVLKNKTYLKNTISKSDKFNYFALLFMNITTCYIVAYFFDSSDILKIFLINLSLVAIINVSYSYYVGKKFKKQYIDIPNSPLQYEKSTRPHNDELQFLYNIIPSLVIEPNLSYFVPTNPTFSYRDEILNTIKRLNAIIDFFQKLLAFNSLTNILYQNNRQTYKKIV